MNIFKKMKINTAVSALVTIIVGVVFVMNPSASTRFLALFAGILVILAGVIDLIAYLRHSGNPYVPHNELLTGVLKLIVGIFMLTHSATIISLISYVFSIYVIIDGIKGLDNVITLAKVKAGGWGVHLIFSLVLTIAGIVMLFNPIETASTVMVWMGIILIFDGITALITLIRLKQFGKEIKRTFKDIEDEANGNIIDVEAEEKE